MKHKLLSGMIIGAAVGALLLLSAPLVADQHGGQGDGKQMKCCDAAKAEGKTCPHHAKGEGKRCQKDGKGKTCPAGERPHQAVKAALADLDAVEKAIQAGNHDEALAALKKARHQLEQAQANMRKHEHRKMQKGMHDGKGKHHGQGNEQARRPEVVNTTCPIMGNKINPEKVPDSLYREHKGKGVGFCCGGCPKAWDKLTEEQKDAKLSAVTQ